MKTQTICHLAYGLMVYSGAREGWEVYLVKGKPDQILEIAFFKGDLKPASEGHPNMLSNQQGISVREYTPDYNQQKYYTLSRTLEKALGEESKSFSSK